MDTDPVTPVTPHPLSDERLAVYRYIEREGCVCAWQLGAAEQAHATALTRAELVYSTRDPQCGRRHYRTTS